MQALQLNNMPYSNHGIEVAYRFAKFDPFERSQYFGCGCSVPELIARGSAPAMNMHLAVLCSNAAAAHTRSTSLAKYPEYSFSARQLQLRWDAMGSRVKARGNASVHAGSV